MAQLLLAAAAFQSHRSQAQQHCPVPLMHQVRSHAYRVSTGPCLWACFRMVWKGHRRMGLQL
jgi:hypothetical protein